LGVAQARSLPLVGSALGVAWSEAGGEYGVGDADCEPSSPTALSDAASV
jgi:hypothetical protein